MQTTGQRSSAPTASGSTSTSRVTEGPEAHNEGLSQQAANVRDRAGEYAEDAVETVKEHPYLTAAVAVGLAFAIGALWKTNSRRRSHWEALYDQMPTWPARWPNAQSLRSYWR